MKEKNAIFASLLMGASLGGVQAADIQVSDLPGSVQNCITDGSCAAFDIATHLDGVFGHMLNLYRTGSTFGTQSWLIGYQIQTGSGMTDSDSGTATPFFGTLWIEAPLWVSADSGVPAEFTVYLDKIQPIPPTTTGQDAISLLGDANALGSGTLWGRRLWGGDPNGLVDPLSLGTLETGGSELLVCVECDLDIRFNLIGLDYQLQDTGGGSSSWVASAAPGDFRKMLLSYQDYDPYSESTRDRKWFVQPVPLPTAFWLFLSGILGLAGTGGPCRPR